MNVRIRLCVTTKLGQTRGGRGSSRLVPRAFSGRGRARIRRGDVSIKFDLVRVFNKLVEAVR